MKQQLPATRTGPVALVAASIALALLLLPGGGVSVSSSGVAPALKLVAGDVAAAGQGSAPAVAEAKAQPNSVASPSAGVAAPHARTRQSPAPSETRSVPAQRAVTHLRVSPKHVVTHTPARVPAAPAPNLIAKPATHGHGKAGPLGHLRKTEAVGFPRKGKAVGRQRKVAPVAVAASKPGRTARAKGSQGQMHGRRTDVPQGPPAVPSGRANGDQSAHGDGASRGGRP
jgi:hypothetical protein